MAIQADNITVEFDAENRVIIVSSTSIIHATKQQDCLDVIRTVHDLIIPLLKGEKGYLILDYGRIWIEPEDLSAYAEVLYAELGDHIYPGGYARYGLGISRVTSKRMSKYMEDRAPIPLFYTREEAEEYIYDLAAKNKALIAHLNSSQISDK
ncbi:MAG: hypothetical protein R3F48_17115 [Candidatus Zixiibacteriota bacterium]